MPWTVEPYINRDANGVVFELREANDGEQPPGEYRVRTQVETTLGRRLVGDIRLIVRD
jgi:hypothetical protein